MAVSGITTTSATISWDTSEPATSQVKYGLTAAYGLTTPLDSTLVSSHNIVLSGLSPDTAYHYRVKSADASGNEAISDDYTFTTLSDTTPPVISEVTATGITTTTAIINWNTDELATTQVEYGTTTDYGLTTLLDETLVVTHSVSLSELDSGTTYHYRVKSKDASGNEAVSADYTFTTSSKPIPMWLYPVASVGGLIVLAAVVFFVVWLRRRPVRVRRDAAKRFDVR